jgi:2-keto-4-pentenoate hydratase/2-oxohepta-3-ene-1,7-dioic acid hydratase in catechol pathway
VRFGSFLQGGRRFAGLVEGDEVRPLRDAAELGRDTPSELLADPPLTDERLPIADLKLLPVIPHPGKIICVGLNYEAHAKEGGHDRPDYPLVTPDEVGDPHDLDISLHLDGETLQSANTSMFIFDIPTLVATISEFTPLAPGDVVLTGTPEGVGYRRDPKVLLKDGDRVLTEVAGIGRLENPVVAE